VREDPQGKRALFETPPIDLPNGNGGRNAVFSHEPTSSATTALIECSSCGVETRVPITDALRRVMDLTLWFPWRRYGRWMTCPACDRRTWCRVRWLG